MPNRDLNPHQAAMCAVWLWHDEYADSKLGTMGFWDSLSKSKKRTAVRMLKDITSRRPYTGRIHS